MITEPRTERRAIKDHAIRLLRRDPGQTVGAAIVRALDDFGRPPKDAEWLLGIDLGIKQ